MAIEFDCPYCTTTIRVPDGASGKKGKCPQCERVLQVPTIEIPPSPPPRGAVPPPSESPPSPVAGESDESAARPAWMKEKAAKVPPLPDDPSGFVEAPADGPPDFAAFGDVDEDLGEPLIRTEPNPPTTPADPPTGEFPPLGSAPSSGEAIPATSRRPRRKSGNLPPWVIPVVGVVLFAGFFAWFNWQSRPDLKGILPATAYGYLELPPKELDATTAGLASSSFTDTFATLEGEPIESQLLRVDFRVRGTSVEIRVLAGSDTRFVKVPKKADPELLEFARESKDALQNARLAELRAAARVFDEWATANDGGSLEGSLQLRVRNAVALNTLAGPLGSHLEAIIAEEAFRCVYEDTEAIYFLLPRAAESFTIVGRRVADLEAPVFYGEYTVEGVQVVPGDPPEDWVDPWLPEDRAIDDPDPPEAEPGTDSTPFDDLFGETSERSMPAPDR